MTFGRWLLVHSLSICILAMLGVGYFFKNELKLNEAYKQLLQIDGDLISLNSQISKNSTDKNKVESSISIEDDTDKATAVEVVDSKVISENDAKVISQDDSGDDSKEFVFKTMPKESVDTVIESNTRDTDKAINNTNSVVPNVAIDKPILTPADYLLIARQAYWNRDYQLSIDSYIKEIEKLPNSPDLYGELGNVYYSISDFDSAAENYLIAGKILIELDDEDRAKKIYDILMSIAPEKADALLMQKNQKYQ